MRRTGFARPNPIDPETGERRFSTFKERAKPLDRKVAKLERSPLKRKRRKPKPGDEPAYKAWIKKLPCCVGGLHCGKADPHHLIDGKGDARKGISQTAPDRYLLPMCRLHHELFHVGKGIFAHFDKAQRLTFQEQECERLRAIWDGIQDHGVAQEPEKVAI